MSPSAVCQSEETRRAFLGRAAGALALAARAAAAPEPDRGQSLVRAVDLDIGATEKVDLCDGSTATVRVTGVRETRDEIRSAVRAVAVQAVVNGKPVTLACANYRLPITVAGVRIDCPFVWNYLQNANEDSWGLLKDVRLRLWPASSPLMPPGSMVYPLRQCWFASDTQMPNEPTFVDGGEQFQGKKIYYHSGCDIGGAEGLVQVVAATDGIVVQLGKELLPGHKDSPARPRYDVIYILDERGWYYRYSHLHSFAERIRLGQKVEMGQRLGLLGKEGASGGWSHLHFEIKCRQPSGKWGTQDSYAFLWEAYQREYAPKLLAVARPHQVGLVGQKIRLDGTRSWSNAGRIARYEWSFSDGGKAAGAVVERAYAQPGTYNEVLKITDVKGRTAFDFAPVQILAAPDREPPTIHAACFPTTGIQPGQQVTFKVRTFRTTEGSETWDFGDGSPPVTVQSDGCLKPLARDGYAVTMHAYHRPGTYLARVERTDRCGYKAITHLCITVERPM